MREYSAVCDRDISISLLYAVDFCSENPETSADLNNAALKNC